MFVIGTTQKLKKEIDQQLMNAEDYREVPEIYKWHANIFMINGRKCLLLMNDATGLNLTLLGVDEPQFDNIGNVIRGSLQQLFTILGIDEEISDQMLNASEEIVYTKTKSRKVLGLMNEVRYAIEARAEGLDYESIDAVEINQSNNRSHGSSSWEDFHPRDTFINYFHQSS